MEHQGTKSILNHINTSIICFVLDESLTIICANDYFYKDSGYSEKEFLACFDSMQQFYEEYPNEFKIIKKQLEEAVENGSTEAAVSLCIPGKYGAVQAAVSVNLEDKGPDGKVMCYAVYNQLCGKDLPIGGKTRVWEKQAGYFKWMMDEYVGNVYVSDMETYELLYLNPVICETMKKSAEQMLGRKCYEVIQGRHAPCPFCTNDLLTEDDFYEWEFYNPTLECTLLIKDRMIHWGGRRARLELAHDNYSLEYKLAKKERERESILNTIPGGFARVDARDMRTILWYGGEFLRLIGYTKEQFEKELHSQCGYVHPEDLERVVDIMQSSIGVGRNMVTEVRIITRGGAVKILTMTFGYVSSQESWDGIASFYSMGLDVTEEREEKERQRRALEEAYQAARVASSAKSNFLSSMSHDIRTPMNAIMGMSAIAQANLDSPDKTRDCLNKIGTSSRHLLSLINEVLDMSKIESGKIDLSPESVHLPDLVQNVTDMCCALIAQKHQEFYISIGQVLHENVIADGDRLQQILVNLLSNAIKYTQAGGTVKLQINELTSADSKSGQFEFICMDNGMGMSEDFIPLIFEPFSRAEDPCVNRLQGTGLGLAITENIVRMMNGTIQVESELGKGSKFTVTVSLELSLEEEPYSNELAGLPVLVVDDDRVTCENAAALLSELGMRGYWVLSGNEAVRCISEAHSQNDDFYAIILDWKMPDMDGLETVKAIRKKLNKDVPIIIISAYDYSEIEEEFLRAGADAFITKPLFKSKMLQVLQLFLTSDIMKSADFVNEAVSPVLAGKKILLAEDNEINREIVAELLHMQEIQVDMAVNGQEALEMFKKSHFREYDAVLMDIQMPLMNGYEATEAIRELNRADAKAVPIVALTANAFASDVAKARNSGMSDHIAKPIDVNRLLEVMERWMRGF